MPMRNSMRLSGDRRVAFGHLPLDVAGATQRIDGAAEFRQKPVACGLDDASVMSGDARIDGFGADRPQPVEGPLLVGADQPRVADHICG
jgi:hypothetical protein